MKAHTDNYCDFLVDFVTIKLVELNIPSVYSFTLHHNDHNNSCNIHTKSCKTLIRFNCLFGARQIAIGCGSDERNVTSYVLRSALSIGGS